MELIEQRTYFFNLVFDANLCNLKCLDILEDVSYYMCMYYKCIVYKQCLLQCQTKQIWWHFSLLIQICDQPCVSHKLSHVPFLLFDQNNWKHYFLNFILHRYLEVLLRRVTVNVGQIVYSPNHKAFVTVTTENNSKENLFLAAEEYADLTGKHFS